MERNIAVDYSFYAACLSRVTGKDEQELRGRRSYPLPYYRAMVSRSLKEDGYSSPEISRIIGRDHSTVLYCIKQLNTALETRGFEDIRAIWNAYRSEVAKSRVARSPIELMAEEFVGRHCNRACGLCDIPRSSCRYLQDERTFIAGANAYRDRLRALLDDFRAKTAQCSLLCGKEDLQATLGSLEAML